MRILYSEGAFMPKSSAKQASEAGYRFLLCYSSLVRWSIGAKRLLFNLVPKLHYLHHIWEDLRRASEDSDTKDSDTSLVYNPVGNCTAQCEDFIGHVARLSRRVSPKVPHSRVLRRYMALLADKLGLLPCRDRLLGPIKYFHADLRIIWPPKLAAATPEVLLVQPTTTPCRTVETPWSNGLFREN